MFSKNAFYSCMVDFEPMQPVKKKQENLTELGEMDTLKSKDIHIYTLSI
jgi:hypothetical protein